MQFFMAALGADWQFFIASRGQPANGANMADQVARATWPTSWAGRPAWPKVCGCLTTGLGGGAGQPTPPEPKSVAIYLGLCLLGALEYPNPL